MPSDWITPDSDVANGWTNPTLAYDANTATYAYYDVPKQQWSPYLELWLATALLCTKVRVWSSRTSSTIERIAVSVYYGGAWHEIYQAALTVDSYVEYAVGSEQLVSAVRVRYWNNSYSLTKQARCNEAAFYGAYPALGRSFGCIIG
jgi:hypothetical protein